MDSTSLGWEIYFNHLKDNKIFECIRNKNVLEISTGHGKFWKLYRNYNPKSIIGLDPDNRWHLEDGVVEKDIIRKGYESYLPKLGYDVIICFGLSYKLPSPFLLMELLARSNPEYIVYEDLARPNIECNTTPVNRKVGTLLSEHKLNCGMVIHVTKEATITAFGNMGYDLYISKSLKLDDSFNGHSKQQTRQYVFKKKEAK